MLLTAGLLLSLEGQEALLDILCLPGCAALALQNLLCPPTMALSPASPGRVNHASPGIASGQRGALVKYLCHLSSGLRVMAAKKPLKTHPSLRGPGPGGGDGE